MSNVIQRRPVRVRRLMQCAAAIGCVLLLSGCVVYPAGPGYYGPHPYYYGYGGWGYWR